MGLLGAGAAVLLLVALAVGGVLPIPEALRLALLPTQGQPAAAYLAFQQGILLNDQGDADYTGCWYFLPSSLRKVIGDLPSPACVSYSSADGFGGSFNSGVFSIRAPGAVFGQTADLRSQYHPPVNSYEAVVSTCSPPSAQCSCPAGQYSHQVDPPFGEWQCWQTIPGTPASITTTNQEFGTPLAVSAGTKVRLEWSCLNERRPKGLRCTNAGECGNKAYREYYDGDSGTGEIHYPREMDQPLAQSVTITGPGLTHNSSSFKGFVEVAPTADSTYTLSCNPLSGSLYSDSLHTASLSIDVVDGSASIAANPQTIQNGDTTTLSWQANNIVPFSCSVYNGSKPPADMLDGTAPDLSGVVRSYTGGLGNDTSGNSNTWQAANMSLANIVVDTPTNSYAILDDAAFSAAPYSPLFGGGLSLKGTNVFKHASFAMPSGKWYWENSFTDDTEKIEEYSSFGVMRVGVALSPGAAYPGLYDTGVSIFANGKVYYNYSGRRAITKNLHTTFDKGDVMMLAFDAGSGALYVGKNGTWLNGANPASNQSPQVTGLTGGNWAPAAAVGQGMVVNVNFGQGGPMKGNVSCPAGSDCFAHAPPSGFASLSTKNLSAPIVQPNKYFDAVTYTGAGGNQPVGGLAFQPSIVWIKNRGTLNWYSLFDAVRGVAQALFPNDVSAQVFNDSNGYVSTFGSSGFSVTGGANVNKLNDTYVAWAWKEDPTAGIDIVTYTGTGSATRGIAHSLGTAPEMIIAKRTDGTGEWYVWHKGLASPSAFVRLNSIAPQALDGGGTSGPSPGVIQVVTSSPFAKDLVPDMSNCHGGGTGWDGDGGCAKDGVYVISSPWAQNNPSHAGFRVADKYYYYEAGTDISYWQARDEASETAPAWVKIDFGDTPRAVGAYTIRSIQQADFSQFNLIDFKFQGSDSGGSPWITLDTQVGVSWPEPRMSRTFVIPNTTDYRAYRVLITKAGRTVGSVKTAAISELHLYEHIPDADKFYVANPTGATSLNASGAAYVAYAFAGKPGFSQFGSYTASAPPLEPFIYTGFKPRFILIKNVQQTAYGQDAMHWLLYDTERKSYSPLDTTPTPFDNTLSTSLVSQEGWHYNNTKSTTPPQIDILADGFKIRSNNRLINNADRLDNLGFYLYAAFAEQPLALSAGPGPDGHTVEHSARFDSDNNAAPPTYLTWTPAAAGDRTKWTWSAWVKRGAFSGTYQPLFTAFKIPQSDATYGSIGFDQNDHLVVAGKTANWRTTTAMYRDPSAWMHVVVSWDTSQSDPIKIYVDNIKADTIENGDPPANGGISNAGQHYIGRDPGSENYYFDGYMADVRFIDGQALGPTPFGAYDANGYWRTKEYTGSYGANGFELTFDSSLTGAETGQGQTPALTKDETYTLACQLPSGSTLTAVAKVYVESTGDPRGELTTASCSTLAGTAYDPDDDDAPLTIRFYDGGAPPDVSTILASVSTNGATQTFSYAVPADSPIKDGNPHTIYAVAVNKSGTEGGSAVLDRAAHRNYRRHNRR